MTAPIRTSSDWRVRCLGGTLLVIKGLNDWVEISRDRSSNPTITSIKGIWDPDDLKKALSLWGGSAASRR